MDDRSNGTIVITGPLIGDHQAHLPDTYEVVYSDRKVMEQAEFNEVVKSACAAVVMTSLQVNQEVIDSAPKLKIISNFGVGYDNIDVEYAHQKEVLVTNTPDVLTTSCAELALALVMMTARKMAEGHRLIENGEFKGWEIDLLLGCELRGKTFGIFGCGRIGQALSKIISGFGMRVIYHNRKKLSPETETELDIHYVGYQELISDSDILVITASLNDQNRHSFELETFKQMKRDSILVNIGRGGVIKESDLVLALKEDLIGGVGLDVFENPAKIPKALRCNPRVTLTPHIGSATLEARSAMSALSIKAILDVINGLEPKYML